MGALDIRNVSKHYRGAGVDRSVLSNINLKVNDREFISLVGLSGCGKTTLLRLIVGLDSEYDGEILLDGARVRGTSRQRGMVFQAPRLLPWLTVEDNLRLAMKKAPRAQQRTAIAKVLTLVGLEGYERHYPSQLSGGMAQRAAIARALVAEPEVLLFDEPLGALDALTRMYMQKELERIWQAEKKTIVLVTHDIDEAILLSDRIAVMSCNPGTIQRTISVNLPRPRERESSQYLAIRNMILEQFNLLDSTHFLKKGVDGEGI